MYLGKMGTSSHFLSAFTIFVKFLPHKNHMDITILGIESSCDDTSAAVIRDRTLLSNVIASQAVHQKYGGVIPELASRAHQQNIVPVVDTALKEAASPSTRSTPSPSRADPVCWDRFWWAYRSPKDSRSPTTFRWWRSIICRGTSSPTFWTCPTDSFRTPTFRSSACWSAEDIPRS